MDQLIEEKELFFPTDMAFGSAIPDKVNSFGVANTPVARITSASRSRHSQVAILKVAIGKIPFFKQQSELQLKSKMKQTFNCSSYLGQGNRLPFSLWIAIVGPRPQHQVFQESFDEWGNQGGFSGNPFINRPNLDGKP